MKAIEFIIEGFKEAETEFITATDDPVSVKKLINDYRSLVNRNQVTGNERNIDWWRKQGWDKFNQFVTNKSAMPTSTQIKRKKVVGKSQVIDESDQWLIVIPLDKDASCFHGAKSDWCTTKINQSHFEYYFYDSNVTLIYCLNKQNGGMWAIAAHTDVDKSEIFDQRDKKINHVEFKSQTGLDSDKIIKLALGKAHQTPVQSSRESYKSAISKLKELIPGLTGRSEEIEQLLLFTKNGGQCNAYVTKLHSIDPTLTSNVPEQIKLIAVYQDGHAIYYINNPSEALQLAAVNQDGIAIQHIKDPSEAVQLAAVKENGYSIDYINNPSEAVQLAAVQQSGMAISNINNPSEAVQLAAVRQYGPAISYIKNPSEALKLAAVKRDGEAIRYIKNPSEAVQLAAVKQGGPLIRYINNPSEAVQLAAVTNDPSAIQYIDNPSEAVQLAAVQSAGMAIRYIKNPSEAVQLDAVQQDGYVIRFIKNPSEAVRRAANR